MHLIDRTDLLQICDLVLGGKAIVTILCSSLEGTETDGQREEPEGRVQGITRVARWETALPVREPIETTYEYLKYDF